MQVNTLHILLRLELWPQYLKNAEPNPNLLRYKNIGNIKTFNVRTLNTINQIHKHTTSVVEHNIKMICMQELRYYHSKLESTYHDTSNDWIIYMEKLVNATIESIGMFLGFHTLNY